MNDHTKKLLYCLDKKVIYKGVSYKMVGINIERENEILIVWPRRGDIWVRACDCEPDDQ